MSQPNAIAKLEHAMRPEAYASYRTHLSALLDIPTSYDATTAWSSVMQGLPVEKLLSLAEQGLYKEASAESLEAYSLRAVASELLDVPESFRLFAVAHVYALAEAIFGNPEKARRWLSKPKDRFDGKTPLEVAPSRDGCCLVQEMLIQLAEGYAF